MKDKNELTIIDDTSLINATVPQLVAMINDAVAHQTMVNPIYTRIHEMILERFENEDELDSMEVKELINLLKVVEKGKLAPVDQLTKLVQATAALYDRSEIEKKSRALDTLIEKFDTYTNYTNPVISVNETVSEPQEDTTMQDLEDIL